MISGRAFHNQPTYRVVKKYMAYPVTISDMELLEQSRLGDHRAFQKLVDRYEKVVAATVHGMLGYGPEADDVGQETFILFYKALNQFRGDARISTYLRRIAVNQSLKALNKRKKWYSRYFYRDNDENDPVENIVDEHVEDFEGIERRELISRAIQCLHPEQRSVVVLRLIEELSTRETAEILGIPEGTVMSRLSRGISVLEHKLAPHIKPV